MAEGPLERLTISELEAEWYGMPECHKYAWCNRRMPEILDLLHWYAQQADDLLYEVAARKCL